MADTPVTPTPDTPAGPFTVQVESSRVSRRVTLHHTRCLCPRDDSPYRSWSTRTAPDLLALMAMLWPVRHRDPWGDSLRGLLRRVTLAGCNPRVPIPPQYMPLLHREDPMPDTCVVICPDSTGKQTVHDPYCGHAARRRAIRNGTATPVVTTSVRALVSVVFPGADENQVADLAESEFQVKSCCVLPLTDPVPVSWDTKLAVAYQRAYTALVAFQDECVREDATHSRLLGEKLLKRVAQGSPQIYRYAVLPSEMADHLAAAEAYGCWGSVRHRAEEQSGADAPQAEQALAWVRAAQGKLRDTLTLLAQEVPSTGTLLEVAWAEARRVGRQHFVRDCRDALNEVTALEGKASG